MKQRLYVLKTAMRNKTFFVTFERVTKTAERSCFMHNFERLKKRDEIVSKFAFKSSHQPCKMPQLLHHLIIFFPTRASRYVCAKLNVH